MVEATIIPISQKIPEAQTRPLLTDEFATQVHEISASFPDDFPIASLLLWSSSKREGVRKHLLKEFNLWNNSLYRFDPESQDYRIRQKAVDDLKRRLERVKVLPQAPDSWKLFFLQGVDGPHKRVLIQAITGEMRVGLGSSGHSWLDSYKTVQDLRAIEVTEVDAQDPNMLLRRKFLAKAF